MAHRWSMLTVILHISLGQVARGLLVVALAVPWTSVDAGAATQAAIADARQELRISEAMAQRLRARIVQARQAPDVTPEELTELGRYGERLEALVAANRAQLARLEGERPAASSSRGAAPARPARARSEFVVVPERTEADELQALDAELTGSLSQFDEMLLKEQERLRSASSTSAPLGAHATRSDLPGTAAEQAPQSAAPAEPASAQAGPEAEERSGTGSRALPRPPTVGRGVSGPAIPPDIADGSDDDIVARQIREAAMNEPDPTLREKLWDEYRKYQASAAQPVGR